MNTGTGAADELETGLQWRRMHPVTPLARSWALLAVLLFIVGRQFVEDPAGVRDAAAWAGPLLIVAAVAVLLLLVLGYSALAWSKMTYAIGSESVHLHQGILFKQQRQARLDRLQAVDITQPLVARVLGLAELKLEVAGGAGSAVAIGLLKLSEAQALRRELLARSAGLELAQGQEAPEAPEREVWQVRAGMLAASLARSGALIAFIVLILVLVVIAVWVGNAAPLFTAIPALLALGGYLSQRFMGEFNFTAAVSPDGIRLRRGMLETRAQTIPPGRVQAIRLRQPLLWRSKDWWRVDLTVAGYGDSAEDNSGTSNVLLPVGDREMALAAVWLVFPDLGVEDPVALLDEALVGSGPGSAFTISPPSARWVDPLSRRRNGFTVTGRGLLVRSGRLVRSLVLVPHERTQSLGIDQGPLERALGLASFKLHIAPGPVSPDVRHLSTADAARLLAEQDERARIARGAAGPELWMRKLRTSVPVPGTQEQEQD